MAHIWETARLKLLKISTVAITLRYISRIEWRRYTCGKNWTITITWQRKGACLGLVIVNRKNLDIALKLSRNTELRPGLRLRPLRRICLLNIWSRKTKRCRELRLNMDDRFVDFSTFVFGACRIEWGAFILHMARKIVSRRLSTDLQGCARDLLSRDRDETRDPCLRDETETRRCSFWFFLTALTHALIF